MEFTDKCFPNFRICIGRGYEGDGIAQGLKAGLAEDQAKAVSISTSAKGSGRGFRMTEPKCRRLRMRAF